MNERAFDYIAMPKGQLPGGPVQTSAGEWVIVIPATIDLASAVRQIVEHRAGRPVTDDERSALAKQLKRSV